MTDEERMLQIAEIHDLEEAHRLADGLLCEVLYREGHVEIVEIYNRIDKWYA